MKLETLTAAAASVILSHQGWFEFPLLLRCGSHLWGVFGYFDSLILEYDGTDCWLLYFYFILCLFSWVTNNSMFISNAVWFLHSLVLSPWIFPMVLLWSECVCTLKFICWNIIPNEGSALMKGVTVPTEEAWGGLLASSAIWGHSKKVQSLKKGPSLDTKSVGALTLDFPVYRTVSNQFLWLWIT